jgi:hypothetical protein
LLRGISFILCTVIAGTVVIRDAQAQEDVMSVVEHGVELRRQGRDADALAEFKRALAIQKSPRVQAQVALAEQALGLWVQAEQDLLSIIGHGSEGDPWIRKNLATLSKALGVIQSHLGSLDLWGSPEGAEVYVDRKPVGKLPLEKPVRVAGGTMLLTARAEGYIETTRTVTVPGGGTAREHVELLRIVPSAEKVAQAKGELDSGHAQPVAAEPLKGPAEEIQRAAQSPEPARRSVLRPVGLVLGIGAVAALAFGVVETVARQHDMAAFNDYAWPNPADPAHPTKSYCNTLDVKPECAPLRSAFDRSNELMLVGYISAGVLALSSAVLFALSANGAAAQSERQRPTDSAALGCAPQLAGASAAGASCRLTF